MVPAKLVTIICGVELEERLQHDLKARGLGYTVTHANGRGVHGPRTFGMVDGANIRTEILVTPAELPKVIELVKGYQGDAVTAYMQDVAAFPRS